MSDPGTQAKVAAAKNTYLEKVRSRAHGIVDISEVTMSCLYDMEPVMRGMVFVGVNKVREHLDRAITTNEFPKVLYKEILNNSRECDNIDEDEMERAMEWVEGNVL